jgi:hypothetical protein
MMTKLQRHDSTGIVDDRITSFETQSGLVYTSCREFPTFVGGRNLELAHGTGA